MPTRWFMRHRLALVGAGFLLSGLLLGTQVKGHADAFELGVMLFSALLAVGGACSIYLGFRLPRHEMWSLPVGVKLPLVGALVLLGAMGAVVMGPSPIGGGNSPSPGHLIAGICCSLGAVMLGSLHLFGVHREYVRRDRAIPRLCTRCGYPVEETLPCSECGYLK